MFGVFNGHGQNNPWEEVVDSEKSGRARWGAPEAGCMAESGALSGGLTVG